MANKVDWTKLLTSVLIDQYEKYQCLHDTKHQFYSNKHARTDALLNIITELKKIDASVEVEDVKKKVTSLRQKFSHENKKVLESQKSGIGTEDVYEPTVWWFEKLQFLTSYVKSRKQTSSLDDLVEVVQPESESIGESSVDRPATPSTPSDSAMGQTPMAFRRKRKYKEKDDVSDPIVDKAVATLQALETTLHAPSSAEKIVKSDIQLYGEYIGRELQSIGDEDIVNDAKNDINNILYNSNKKLIQLKKQNAQLFIIENFANIDK